MKNIFIGLGLVILAGTSALAQNEIDALRYSYTYPYGTARAMGAAGAFGAVGGDFTSVGINPAGLGLYRSSEAVITPGLTFTNISSTYINNTESAFNTDFNFSNFGFVFNNLYKESGAVKQTGWVSTSFAFGMNKKAKFDRSFRYSSTENNTFLLDEFLSDLNNHNDGAGIAEEDIFVTYPFSIIPFDHFWYDFDPNDPDSMHYIKTLPSEGIRQEKIQEVNGGINEFALAVGANYSNKLYLGATLGIAGLNYSSNLSIIESDAEDTIPNFESFSYTEIIDASGIGANLKLGAIYRVNNNIRLGGAVHTPTAYSIHENFDYFVTGSSNYEVEPVEILEDSEYNITTPWRLLGNFAFIAGKSGFISLDYEWADFGGATLNLRTNRAEDEIIETEVNRVIQRIYAPTHNVRLGGEYVYNQFRFRAGGAYGTSPFQEGEGVPGADQSRTTFSFGAGIQEDDYFLDVAVLKHYTNEYDQPYTLEIPVEGAKSKIRQAHLMFSAGFKF